MRLIVNGEALELPDGATARDLIAHLGIRLEAVALERNGAIVRRRDLETTLLSEGDKVEVVTFVGGG